MPKVVKKEGMPASESSVVTLEKQVAINLVELQKAYMNLAEKFDALTKQNSALLGLFEAAAKSFAEHPAGGERDAEFADKINRLLEQNRLIIRGLELVETKLGEKPMPESQMPKPAQSPKVMEQEEFQQSVSQPQPPMQQAPQPVQVPASPVSRPLPRF